MKSALLLCTYGTGTGMYACSRIKKRQVELVKCREQNSFEVYGCCAGFKWALMCGARTTYLLGTQYLHHQ